MNSKVAIYDSHEKALNAVKVLESNDFPLKQISLVGKAEIVDDNLQIVSLEPIKNAPAMIGAGAGTLLGLLTGIGIFAVPGFGLLYGAGAIVGAIGGFNMGLISGGLITLLATLGIEQDKVIRYEERLNEGKFLVIVHGTLDEIEKAERILHTEGTHLEFGI